MAKKRQKKKLRVAFRKNRGKKKRDNKLTREVREQGVEEHDFQTGERISGKGDLTRHRTIIGDDETGEALRAVDESKCLVGRVISAIGQNSHVQAENGKYYTCTVRRVLRTMASDARNVVVTGDNVLFSPLDDETGVIERVNPRHGTVSREAGGREHMIVSNVDQVIIVVSALAPPFKPNLVDRFLISAEKGDVEAIVCINKIDLLKNPAELQPWVGLYSQLGYTTLLTSVENGTGIDHLRAHLAGKESVFTGQSGVGKSSLHNAIQPKLELQTNVVSNWTNKGKHTTRRATLIELQPSEQFPQAGWVVDTPGIRQFELWNVDSAEVEAYFLEFRPFITRCKFPDCSHTHENNCGVKEATSRGLITESRYESYLKIVIGDRDDAKKASMREFGGQDLGSQEFDSEL